MRISKIGGKQLRHILYMAALSAKKTVPRAKPFTTRWGQEQGTLLFLPFTTTTQTSIRGGKVGYAVPRRLLQKTGLKVWFFRQFVLCAVINIQAHSKDPNCQ